MSDSSHEDVTDSLRALPTQPAGVPWPTTAWPEADPTPTRPRLLEQSLANLFDTDTDDTAEAGTGQLGETHALLVIHQGQLVVERYGDGLDASSTLPSWSMAKSITAVFGAMVGVNLDDAVRAPEWRNDDRGQITYGDLLSMSSGLDWTEIYEADQPSDVVEMLFGDSNVDVAAYAAGKPAGSPPGTHYQYSSGTTNIVARHIADHLGCRGDAAAFEAELRRRLFDPIGMTSATPKFDPAGTFIGSSFCYCTARDFARFGLLCLRGGHWGGAQLLPAEAIDHFRTPNPLSVGVDDFVHGAHFWVHDDDYGTFACHGYLGQYVWMVPDLDLIVVRSGVRPEDAKQLLVDELRNIVRAFA